MKKNLFVAAFAIAMAAVTVTSCGNKAKEEAKPAGTPIGEMTMVNKDDGTISLQDKTGYELGVYAKVIDNKSFIEAVEPDGKKSLMSNAGATFCHCDSFVVKPYYTVKSGEKSNKEFVLASIQDWIVGFDTAAKTNLCGVEGKKLEEYPLTNGQLIFKLKDGYGIAKIGSDEPIMAAECTEVVVVNAAGNVYYLIKTPGWAGYIDTTGKDIKALTPAQFKTAKKAGTELWSEGKVSARTVKNI